MAYNPNDCVELRWGAPPNSEEASTCKRHAPVGNPGFKRFRPIVRDNSGVLRRLTNSKIAKNPHYADFSLEQSRLGVEDFYDRMDEVMSPEPLDPLRAMEDAIAAAQRVKMIEYRTWFQERHWPTHA